MDKIHEYSNGELTIIWQPNICQHAGIWAQLQISVAYFCSIGLYFLV